MSVCEGCGALVRDSQSPTARQTTHKPNASRFAQDALFQANMAALRDAEAEDEAAGRPVSDFQPARVSSKPEKAKVSSRNLCSRCHGLLHHYRPPEDLALTSSDDDFHGMTIDQIFSPIRADPRAVLINVVDIADLPLSLIDARRYSSNASNDRSRRIIHVINRADLYFSNPLVIAASRESLVAALARGLGRPLTQQEQEDVFVVSGLKNWGLGALVETLNRTADLNENVYLVGSANAGKSSLIGALLRRSAAVPAPGDLRDLRLMRSRSADRDRAPSPKHGQAPIITPIPGTTLGCIRLPLSRFAPQFSKAAKGNLIDTPGVLMAGMAGVIKPEHLQKQLPRRLFKRPPKSMRVGTSVLADGLFRVDFVAGTADHILLTEFMNPKLQHVHTHKADILQQQLSHSRATSAKPMALALDVTLTRERGGPINAADIVFKDLGAISVGIWKGFAQLKVYTPAGQHVATRPPLIENPYSREKSTTDRSEELSQHARAGTQKVMAAGAEL
ncbi:hypothetical protein PYCC9005_002943 [Savitreella phatthalungensis]